MNFHKKQTSLLKVHKAFLQITMIVVLFLILNLILHILLNKTQELMEWVIDVVILFSITIPFYYIVSIKMRDIKDSQHTLIEREAIYRSLVEESITGVSIVQDEKFVYLNPRYAEIFGYTQEELLERDVIDVVIPDDRPLLIESIRKRIVNETSNIHYQVRGLKKDNSIVNVEVHGSRMIYNGRPAVFSTMLDVTKHKRAEKALCESEERFRTAFDYAATGMTLAEPNGRLFKVNDSFCKMVGYSEQELLDTTFQAITHPEDLEVNLDKTRKLLSGEIDYFQMEKRYIQKSGQIVWGLAVVSLIRDDKGNPSHYITQIQDITKRKETEEMLRKSDKLSAVGQLAAGVAHEVRNPLTVLKGFVQLLQTKSNENEQYYDIMLSEVERIESIISEFLVLAKPQMAKFQMEDVLKILKNVTSLVETKAIMNNIQIDMECNQDIPFVECDVNQLKQVFINMLQNAIEAMPGGGEIIIIVQKGKSNTIQISFIDQGCGIQEERISKLGEPFYSNKEKGTGLGLMVSYKIIEGHKGSIHVKSKLGEGTTFDVILPISQSSQRVFQE